MTCERTAIEGLLILKPKRFEDPRGYFFESFNQKTFAELVGSEYHFVQDNESKSQKNVLRGLHFQAPPFAQGKLVRVIKGRVLDVAVDIRKDSKTYGQHVALELSESNGLIFWIPPGFAHGFLTLEEDTIFSYKCTDYYAPAHEGAIMWNDASLQINWQEQDVLVSEKDKHAEQFTTFNSPF